MRYVFGLVLLLVIGLVMLLPSRAQAGPFVYRGGAWDRWVNTGYMFPGLWTSGNTSGGGSFNPNTSGYNYQPRYYYPTGNGYYSNGYRTYSNSWRGSSGGHYLSPSRDNPE